MDPVAVDRVRPPTLSDDEQSRVLDVAAARSARDYALMVSWLDVGPRPSEMRRLDVDDAELSARGGRLLLTRTDGQQRWVELMQASIWVLLGWRTARDAARATTREVGSAVRHLDPARTDTGRSELGIHRQRDRPRRRDDGLTPWMLRATIKARL
ncbi:hypothetical protein [Nocardia sp. NPDC004711]